MTKIIGIIIVLALIGGGWYVYQQNQEPAEEAWTPSASFACDDGSHFIAEFPNEANVDIVVDGVVTASVPRWSGDGQRFENDTHAYTFAGEQVVVVNKIEGNETTCSQPVDPNSPPMNFGDAPSMDGGVKPNAELVVSESIVGTWQSTEDAKFVREFRDGGVVVDLYDGEEVSRGTFKAFTSVSPLQVAFPLEANAVYLQLTMEGTQSDVLNFKVAAMTESKLTLIYMDRGGALTFTRVGN